MAASDVEPPTGINRIKIIINVIVNDRVRKPIREMISRDAECESRARAHVRSDGDHR